MAGAAAVAGPPVELGLAHPDKAVITVTAKAQPVRTMNFEDAVVLSMIPMVNVLSEVAFGRLEGQTAASSLARQDSAALMWSENFFSGGYPAASLGPNGMNTSSVAWLVRYVHGTSSTVLSPAFSDWL